LRIANAGQEQTLLYHGGRCEKVRIVGFPLGIYEDATYDEQSFILDPGDIVVFYSDGIGDAQSPEGAFLGSAGLIKLIQDNHHLPANGIADYILEGADRFSGGKHPADDRTLVVLKVNEDRQGLLP
jgi:sigma-B regulation protein RsbU (phosphoserine phosphatase)